MATIYVRVGPGARDVQSMRAPHIPSILIVLDGPHACLNLTHAPHPQISIPTCDRELLDPEYFAHWIPTMQGPIPTDCDATDDQRHLLLCIALACHALLSGWPGVDQNDWSAFIGRLTEVALEVAADERADERLEELVDWLKDGLPLDLFEGPHIPAVHQDRFGNPLVVQRQPAQNVPPLHWHAPAPNAHMDDDELTDDDMPPLLENDDVSTGSMFEGMWPTRSS
ncbi:hypothetical protein C2E23DRAFT_859787 [Lenzites betulinus]|nr:hypothetical protein C2E23DRAFT_859787 [Lenzites betulinus]